MPKIKGLCRKCSHYGFCTEVCEPVAILLKQVSSKYLYEINTKHGIELWNPKDVRIGSLGEVEDKLRALATSSKEGYSHELPDFEPETLQSNVYYLRVFCGHTIQDVCDELGITKTVYYDAFKRANRRVEDIIKLLNKQKWVSDWNKKHTKTLDEKQRWYICYKIFGMSHSQLKEVFPDLPGKSSFRTQMWKRTKQYLADYDRCVSGAA